MAQEKLAASLQEDLLTLLCYSDAYGKTISKLITSNYFEGDYRVISDKALAFWSKHNTAPKQHIADLLSDILEDKQDRRGATYRRILVQMLEVKDQINGDFVLGAVGEFVRMQRAKEIILQSAERLDAQGINGLVEVESLLYGFLRERESNFAPGLKLSDIDKVLAYFENSQTEFCTGIKELDQASIIPMRGKLFFFIAATGKGKTWMLIQLGKMAFLRRKKVLHISLEIEAEEVAQRYYQALFGASKRDDTNKVSTMKFTKTGQLDSIDDLTVDVPFTFESNAIREELVTRVNHFGLRAGNIQIKRFAMRSLTVEQLEAYMENLEAVDNFIPDLLLVDYPGIMKTDAKNHRISLGRLVEELRGLSQRRNCALAAVHQGSKESVNAELVKATHASEDWSTIGTSDFVITYSQTAAEKQYGLARLFVDKARSESDKFGILIAQSYKTGQFCLESTRLSDSYSRLMEQMKDYGVEESASDDE